MKSLLRIAILITAVTVSCIGIRSFTDFTTVKREFHNPASKMVLVAAHRGAHNDNFENSIASTKQAIKLGVDIIEVDVKSTKDGTIVLMHDATIDRTTTGTGKVEELTLAEIRTYRLKDAAGTISKETVPTFENFLKVTKGKILVDIDMKTDNVEGIMRAVAKTGTNEEVFYFDNDYDQLRRIKNLNGEAQIMPRAYSVQMADSALTQFSPPVVHIDPSFEGMEVSNLLKKGNARIWINTLGDIDAEIRKGGGVDLVVKLIENGANIIQTDEPERLLQILRDKGLRE